LLQNVTESVTKSNESKSIELEKEKELESELDVDVVELDGIDTDLSTEKDSFYREGNTFELQNGTLGRGVVLLTPEQDEALLEKLGFDGYNHYVSKLADFIIEKGAKVANHYATILKWASEDAKV
jgi:hypothetical protein